MPARHATLPLLLPALLLLAGCEGKSQTAAAPTPPAEVSVIQVARQNVPLSTELPGRTSAYRIAEVRPQVSGIVLKRMFEEGANVTAGQQLYQIDPATYHAAVQSAQADLAKSRANLKSVEAKASRYADLVQINAVSRQDYDDIMASLDQAKAQILVSQAAVDTARINLEYTKVYAPISGRIGKSAVTEGALVTANQATALSTITQLDPIYVDISQSSSELIRLRQAFATGSLQQPVDRATVRLTIDGIDQPYEQEGQLKFSDVTVDQTTGAVPLRAVFPNPGHRLYPGLFVRARIDQGVRENAILIPQQSLVRNPDGSTTVWVVGADHKTAPRPVAVGRAVGDKWLVDNGLEAGELVIVAGLQKVRPNAEVRIAANDSSTGAQR